MAYEWVSPVSVAVVGVIGIGTTWWTGNQGRSHVERMADKGFAHERRMAAEARDQQRLGEAYIKLLVIAESTGAWAQKVKPTYDTGGWKPPLPEVADQIVAGAHVNAYGSDDVLELFDKWREVVGKMIGNVELIDLERADDERGRPRSGDDYGLAYQRLHELRRVELEARDELTKQVKAELRTARTGEPRLS